MTRTPDIGGLLARHGDSLGLPVLLPEDGPSFAFSIPADGRLPLDGALPSIIDHCGDVSHFAAIPDLGARLRGFVLEHPDPRAILALYQTIGVSGLPQVVPGPWLRYRAEIDTPRGLRHLT